MTVISNGRYNTFTRLLALFEQMNNANVCLFNESFLVGYVVRGAYFTRNVVALHHVIGTFIHCR